MGENTKTDIITFKKGEKMKIIVCIDDKKGLSFANKRQSMDRKLREDILLMCHSHTLWMDHYSYKQFAYMPASQITVLSDYNVMIPKQDFLFIERSAVTPFIDRCDMLITYNWNRHYPADLYLDIDLSKWHLENKTEFEGSSHPKITKEVYVK